jgi:PAS domain S-box-containing protein
MNASGGEPRPPSVTVARHLDASVLRLLVESTTDYAIFMLDAEGHVASWNAGAERIKGYRADEIIGQHFSVFYPAEAIARNWPATELEIAAREGRFEDEGWRVRKDGSLFWANVIITALRNEHGHLVGFGKVSRDLTERRGAEQQLRESEERFRLIVDCTVDYAIFMLDTEGRVASWNQGAERIKGYRAHEIIGQHFSTFYTTEAIVRRWPEFELSEALRVGRFEDEGWRVRKDGSQFWANVVITALRGPDGAHRGFAKVTRDITQRKQHEQRIANLTDELEQARVERKLVESELRLASIIGTAMDAIVMCDEQLRIVLFNRSAEEMFGCAAPNALTKELPALIPDLDVFEDSAAPTAAAKGSLQRRVEVEAVCADGSRIPIEVSISDVIVHDQRFFTVIARDISERRRTEAKLREADRRKDVFLGMLAHELRNPLAAITTAGEVLHRTLEEPGTQKLIGVVKRQTRALARMVDDLLDVSRVTLGKIQLAHEPLLLGDVVARAGESARDPAAKAGLRLDVKLPAEPVWLMGDLTRLEQVLANLLNNAVKFTPPGGAITVDAARDGDQAVIRVRDTGVGIEPAVLPKIFDLFVQGDTSLDRANSGLGIGLALVRQVVTMHGGRVTARSGGAGTGTEFIVSLPVSSEEVAGDEKPSESAPRAETTMRVLVVDDQHDLADCIALLVQAIGHRAEALYDGAEALAACRADRPDLMLVDIGMPGMTGYELARAVRADPELSEIRLVALTGYGLEEDRARVLAAGFDLHLTKPVGDTTLRDVLDALAPARARSD